MSLLLWAGLGLATIVVIFLIRVATPETDQGLLEVQRLQDQLDIERNLKEEFKEAYLRQKAIYERDLQIERALKEEFLTAYLREKALTDRELQSV